MADRKAELEKKRKKLEQLRIAREQKKKETADKDAVTKAASVGDPRAREREHVNQLVSDLIGGKSPSRSPAKSPEPSAEVQSQPRPEATPTPALATPQKKAVKLVVDSLASVNIKPRAVEVYAKQTQTDVVQEAQASDSEDDLEQEPVRPEKRHDSESEGKRGEGEGERGVIHPTSEMSTEQVERIVASDDFSSFMERASRLVERALCEPSDILFDILKESEVGGDTLASFNVMKKKQLFDERWSQNRSVTAMDWSSQHPELLLVSHHTNPNAPHDPDGVVLIWDLMFQKDTPDYVFNCQSAVMSVAFSRFHPSYVIGGTYSGQVVLWDMRSGRRTPIQRSPLSSSAHTHPIYCLDVVGSQNAHNLISVSNQGRVCSWNLDMLSQPQEILDLSNRQTRPAAVTSLSFPLNDVNKFIVGSEECAVYQAQRHGSKPGITVQYDGHFGPITAVSSHRALGAQVDLSHLFLTSSFDWTIKLWSTKLQNEQQISQKTAQPLTSFENNTAYVYDVKWSPVHPALFASADGAGRLDMWNINVDTEVPVLSESLDVPLTKLQWSPNGHHLACGDMDGKVHIFEAGEGLCCPPADEWAKVHQMVLDLQSLQEPSS